MKVIVDYSVALKVWGKSGLVFYIGGDAQYIFYVLRRPDNIGLVQAIRLAIYLLLVWKCLLLASESVAHYLRALLLSRNFEAPLAGCTNAAATLLATVAKSRGGTDSASICCSTKLLLERRYEGWLPYIWIRVMVWSTMHPYDIRNLHWWIAREAKLIRQGVAPLWILLTYFGWRQLR